MGYIDPGLHDRVRRAHQTAEGNLIRLELNRTRLDTILRQLRADRPKRDQLHDSAYARLLARLDSLPVIEQAKGILIAESGCDPDEAFEMLRLASQRTNVKVRDLAADIVKRAIDRGRRHQGAPHHRPRVPAKTAGP